MSDQLEMFPEEEVHYTDEKLSPYSVVGLQSCEERIKVWRSKQPDDSHVMDMARQAIEVTYRFRDLVQGIEGPGGNGGLYSYFDNADVCKMIREKGTTPEEVKEFLHQMVERVEAEWALFNKRFLD